MLQLWLPGSIVRDLIGEGDSGGTVVEVVVVVDIVVVDFVVVVVVVDVAIFVVVVDNVVVVVDFVVDVDLFDADLFSVKQILVWQNLNNRKFYSIFHSYI